jgi:hypothetical protein
MTKFFQAAHLAVETMEKCCSLQDMSDYLDSTTRGNVGLVYGAARTLLKEQFFQLEIAVIAQAAERLEKFEKTAKAAPARRKGKRVAT